MSDTEATSQEEIVVGTYKISKGHYEVHGRKQESTVIHNGMGASQSWADKLKARGMWDVPMEIVLRPVQQENETDQ